MNTAIKERPILFSAPMVRAILAGTKTQTRRMVKLPRWAEPEFELEDMDNPLQLFAIAKATGCLALLLCPYGKEGDRLWVRETWSDCWKMDPDCRVIAYRADGLAFDADYRWKPSIFMPRSASRITLQVQQLRVQRLQDISDADALAEGVIHLPASGRYAVNRGGQYLGQVWSSATEAYQALWESINGAGSWDANPWVWVISFSQVTP